MQATNPADGKPIAAGVTLLHVAPPFMVTWIWPSSVPAQRMLTARGEADSAVMVPSGAGVTVLAYLPAVAGTSQL